jgi:hypothetical protein
VTLRLFQRLFIDKVVWRIDDILRTRSTLVSVLGEETADEKLRELLGPVIIPPTTEEFAVQVREWFLEQGVPVRVFTNRWISSLDDQHGQGVLYAELESAFDLIQKGKRYHAENKDVFAVEQK